MKKRRGRARRGKGKNLLSMLLVLAAVALYAYFGLHEEVADVAGTEVVFHFVDVGQGDCTLIQSGSIGILIDAGEAPYGKQVSAYLRRVGITKLEYVIGTHPHSDHIGGLAEVVSDFGAEHVIMPDATANTASFEKLMNAIDSKNLDIDIPKPGTKLETTIPGLELTVLSPASGSYDDLNNYSIVLKAVYGKTSFILTGDAEALAENEMLSGGWDLSADVLQVGHHGSSSSTSAKFLDAVDPDIAVISCAKDNSYGHPHAEVMSRLEARGIKIFRTDESGNIVMATDGTSISVSID